MRAVVHDRYGPPEVLRVAEVERPVPQDDEVLVRVHASTVTRGDAMGVRSVEYRFARVFTGIRRPRRTIFGSEFAGRVDRVRSLGARDVLDRCREDFTKDGRTYDVVFDAVGRHSFRRCRRSLKPAGDQAGPRIQAQSRRWLRAGRRR